MIKSHPVVSLYYILMTQNFKNVFRINYSWTKYMINLSRDGYLKYDSGTNCFLPIGTAQFTNQNNKEVSAKAEVEMWETETEKWEEESSSELKKKKKKLFN